MTYQGKSYQRLLQEAMDDESTAGDMYRYMANISPNADAAEILRNIAADEDRHYRLVKYQYDMLQMNSVERKAHEEQMEYLLGHRHPSQVGLTLTNRPFPQTYGDWVDLAESMKSAAPNDLQLAVRVNENLEFIATDDPVHSEASKRWLMQKAGELGIR